jgi:hypothetical protein
MIPLISSIPFNAKIYWLLWTITLAITIAIGYRNRRRTGLTIEQIILIAGFSLVGVFSLFKVLLMVYNFHAELQEKIDWDGITALTISSTLGIALALKEVKKLF